MIPHYCLLQICPGIILSGQTSISAEMNNSEKQINQYANNQHTATQETCSERKKNGLRGDDVFPDFFE